MARLRQSPAAVEPARDCPCVQRSCPLLGDCVACVRAHRVHRRHIPECLQPVMRGLVAELAGKLELGVVEGRRTPGNRRRRTGAKLVGRPRRDAGRQA